MSSLRGLLSFDTDSSDGNGEITTVFKATELSSEDEPMSDLESIESKNKTETIKRALYKKGLYFPPSEEICNAYVPVSESAIKRHVYYNYPLVPDPGIEKALLGPEPVTMYANNGQKRYLDLCSEMNLCLVRLFYRNLLNSEINLSYYCVEQKGVQAMAIALQNNESVTRLNLTDNFLNDDACYHLGEMLQLNNTLQELILNGCRIGPSGLINLGNCLYLNRTLHTLDLSRNKLNCEGGEILTKIIADGFPVKKLNLSNNNLGEKFALALVNDLEKGFSITHLDLSWNNFHHDRSTVRMFERLAQSEHLQDINLSFNALEGEIVAGGILELLNIPGLQVLDLSYNRLRGEALDIITSGLIQAKMLITFNISFNPLTPDDACNTLQKMLKRRVKLRNLLMENVCVNISFLEYLARVKRMKSRKNFSIVYGDVLHNWTVKGPDHRALLLKRADYLSKRKLDIILYFLKLNKENEKPISVDILIELMKFDDIPLSEGFIKELSYAFPGPKKKTKGSVDFQLICEYIQRIWPGKELPPTPPPEPEVPPPLPNPPKSILKKKKKVDENI